MRKKAGVEEGKLNEKEEEKVKKEVKESEAEMDGGGEGARR